MKYIVNSTEETEKIAQDFVLGLVSKTDSATVIGLYGDLGAGKTNFTQAVAKALKVEESVVSPTFVIEKIYKIVDSSQHLVSKFENLIHIDAYRLESSAELLRLGWKEITSDPRNLILIEWPEKVSDIMPKHIKIYLNHLENENSREIEID